MGVEGGRALGLPESVRPPLSAAQSVEHLLKIIDTLTPAHSGKFLNYDGAVYPY